MIKKQINELVIPETDLEMLDKFSRDLDDCGRELDNAYPQLLAEYEKFLKRERNEIK